MPHFVRDFLAWYADNASTSSELQYLHFDMDQLTQLGLIITPNVKVVKPQHLELAGIRVVLLLRAGLA